MTKDTVGIYILGAFLAFVALEFVGGKLRWNRATARSTGFATVGFIAQSGLALPAVAVIVGWVFDTLFPHSVNRFAEAAFWATFPFFFVGEEFCHYWIHRWAHEKRWLWKFHRTHHSATELNSLVLFRFNIFWTVMQPQVWFGAVMLHLGLVKPMVVSAVITFSVNVLTHTSYRWDLAMRKWPGMNAVFNVLEKFITLPDTHHAHHGLGKKANVSGNYAVTLFIFDTLLGTAKWPRARQERFGLNGDLDWREELFWPVVRKS